MPFTRITLHQSYNDTQIMQISDILQQSLETEFAVPPHDRFQVFERLPANQHVFDRRYKSAGTAATVLFNSIFWLVSLVHWRRRGTSAVPCVGSYRRNCILVRMM